jgi:triosephosphate isomerase
MRKPMIAGNWKLHKTIAEATRLVSELIPAVASNQNVDIVVAPVYTALPKVAETLAGSNIKLAAQNCYPEPQGAFTGEVSPLLLKDAGCEYVIIGHSERRQLFAETDALAPFSALVKLWKSVKPARCSTFCASKSQQDCKTSQPSR